MRRPHYRRRHHYLKKIFWLIVLIGFGYGLHWFFVQKNSFDDKAINQASILKGRTFDASVQEIETPQGLKAWLIEDKSIPIVSMSFIFERAGYAYEPEGKYGLSSLAADMLLLGAGDKSRAQMADLLELNGINISFSEGQEDFVVSMVTPLQNLDKATAAVTDILTSPRFSEDDLKSVKLQTLESLKLRLERPETHLQQNFAQSVYGQHVYARSIDDIISGVQRVSADDLQDYVKRSFARDNVIIGIAGDISAEEAAKILERIFEKLPAHNLAQSVDKPTLDLTSGRQHIDYASPQIVSRFAVNGVARLDDDFYPLYIANYIFGGAGLTSRLSLEAREKRGLTYGIYTSLSSDEKAPLIVGGFSTSPQNSDELVAVLEDEWQKFAQNGATLQEFEAAKNYLSASYNLRFNSTAGLADMLAYIQKYRLGADFLQKRNALVEAVTLEQVNAAAAKYFANRPKIITLGKIEQK